MKQSQVGPNIFFALGLISHRPICSLFPTLDFIFTVKNCFSYKTLRVTVLWNSRWVKSVNNREYLTFHKALTTLKDATFAVNCLSLTAILAKLPNTPSTELCIIWDDIYDNKGVSSFYNANIEQLKFNVPHILRPGERWMDIVRIMHEILWQFQNRRHRNYFYTNINKRENTNNNKLHFINGVPFYI